MEQKTRRILSIGAHPDDADTSPSGLLLKLRDAGWEIRLLSLTDGSAGTFRTELPREEIALQRRAEAAASGRIFGGRYDVLFEPDGQLMPTLENREALIRYIRRFRPDVILTNRPNDYHADHRNTALLVQDASFLLTVPKICQDTPYLEHTPVILFWDDGFQRPYPFRRDIVVPLKRERREQLTEIASCHECQYFDWLYWPDHLEKLSWSREEQVRDLHARFMRNAERLRAEMEEYLVKKYGPEQAAGIPFVQCFEISEYGEAPSEEFLSLIEKPE